MPVLLCMPGRPIRSGIRILGQPWRVSSEKALWGLSGCGLAVGCTRESLVNLVRLVVDPLDAVPDRSLRSNPHSIALNAAIGAKHPLTRPLGPPR